MGLTRNVPEGLEQGLATFMERKSSHILPAACTGTTKGGVCEPHQGVPNPRPIPL